jgi:hypothetical protein
MLLHIGMPKTATTMLQERLFAQHPQVDYLGKHKGPHKFNCLHTARFMEETNNPNVRVSTNLINAVQEEVQLRRRSNKTLVISKEGLTSGTVEKRRWQAIRFHEAFGECHILITTREPLSFIEALYFQQLKGFYLMRISYRVLRHRYGLPPCYFDINSWLDTLAALPCRGGLTHLECADTAEIYSDVFGRDNVHVVPYELLNRDTDSFVCEVARSAGIDVDNAIQLCQGQSLNVRWSEKNIDNLKQFEKTLLGRWRYRFSLHRPIVLNRLIGVSHAPTADTSPKAKVTISRQWSDRITEIGRDQTQKLLENWDLPLAELNYPVGDLIRKATAAA